jgi:hypothetical protein
MSGERVGERGGLSALLLPDLGTMNRKDKNPKDLDRTKMKTSLGKS